MTDQFVVEMMQWESAAAALFEGRWTRAALKRVDPELHQAIVEQQQFFHEALILGEKADVEEHGEAMMRGWHAAYRRMVESGEPDCAYLIGDDPRTGIRVAISHQRAADIRVRELMGEKVIFLTPDEVAAMFAGLQQVATVKALWPGAEITRHNAKSLTPEE